MKCSSWWIVSKNFSAAMKLLFSALAFTALAGVRSTSELKVHIATWNLYTNEIPKDLSDLVGVDKDAAKPGPDMIVVGLQNVGLMAKVKDNKWVKALKMHVFHDSAYFLINANIHKGNCFVIFGNVAYHSNFDKSSVKSRRLNVKLFSNVGGIVTKFKWFDRRFAFVNLHLDGRLDDDKRLRQYNRVAKKIKTEQNVTTDYVFWLGNLNFKIDLNLTYVTQLVKKNEWDTLLVQDQLKKAQKTKQGFEDFKEPEIKFRPSFRFNPGTDEYKQGVAPAWTDRILYQSETEKKIEPGKYESVEKYKQSDHKPVVGEFTLEI